MTTHSKVGASSAKRWLACPGSVPLSERTGADPYLAQDPSEVAEDGTFAHRALELIISDNLNAREAVAQTAEETGRAPAPWCLDVVDEAYGILSHYMHREYRYWAEHRVTFAPAYDGFGTLDFAAWKPGRLIVADLKTGVGVRVTAHMNEQLLCYAWGQLRELRDWEVNVVELIVIQPRVPGGITRYELTRKALEDWVNNVLYVGLSATQDANPKLKVGEHCRFCPALVHCPAQRVQAVETAASAAFPEHAADAEWVLQNAPIIRKYLAEVERYALKKALAGKPPLGYKVVPGKTNRVWRDGAEDTLALLYGDEVYEAPRLKSPAQVENLPGGRDIATQFAYQPQGAPTLAPESDPRAPFQHADFKQLFKGQIDA